MPVWAVQIIIAIVMMVASYLLTPKMKNNQNSKPQAIDTPTVNAGRSIPVVWGTVRVKSPNVLYFGGQQSEEIKR